MNGTDIERRELGGLRSRVERGERYAARVKIARREYESSFPELFPPSAPFPTTPAMQAKDKEVAVRLYKPNPNLLYLPMWQVDS